MSINPSSDPTVGYYDARAERYVRETFGLDVEGLYEPFLALVPAGGHILDAGCGSGRDSLAFLLRGYQVTAFDASPEMARLASKATGLKVAVCRLQQVGYEAEFDAVWACASLLHVPRREMDDVLARLTRALRPGGVWYMSFKCGEGEGMREGRFFNDYTEELLRQLIGRQPALTLLRAWQTADVQPDRRGTIWLNTLVRRT
jgi:SAM-dependent methyltransferase